MMPENVGSILERLADDELAQTLVALLRDHPRERWQEVLATELLRRRNEMIEGGDDDETLPT